MLAAVVFVPSAPLLVSALAGPGADDTVAVRDAVVSTFAEATVGIDRWVAVGAGDAAGHGRSGASALSGTFAGYGVDVPVTLETGPDAGNPASVGGELDLSMLIAGWLREQTGLARIRPMVIGPQTTPGECARIGAELSASIDAEAEPVGIVVVGDGAIALSARAPGGGLRPEAVELQAAIDAAFAAGDTDALARLDVEACAAQGVGGRVAWQVAAEVCAGRSITADLRYADAPFGVGYVVATWTPDA